MPLPEQTEELAYLTRGYKVALDPTPAKSAYCARTDCAVQAKLALRAP